MIQEKGLGLGIRIQAAPDVVAQERRNDRKRARQKKQKQFDACKELALPHHHGLERGEALVVEVDGGCDGQHCFGSKISLATRWCCEANEGKRWTARTS